VGFHVARRGDFKKKIKMSYINSNWIEGKEVKVKEEGENAKHIYAQRGRMKLTSV
jgi:hypothetical protein